MRVDTYTQVTIAIILACLAFYFQKTIPLLASISALVSAFIFIKAANRIRRGKKQLKMQNDKDKTNKKH